MDVRAAVLWVIVGAGLVTVIPRVVPLTLLSRVDLPPLATRWLGYMPIAILAALLAQAVTAPDGHLMAPPHNLALLAALPTLTTAALTRSLIGTVGVGVASTAILRLLMH